MKKRLPSFLLLAGMLTCGAGVARALDIQSAPVAQAIPSPAAAEKQSPNIGPHDPEKEKPLGVGVNFFLTKNMAVTSSLSLPSPDAAGQSGLTGSGGGSVLSASRVGGTVGFRMLF